MTAPAGIDVLLADDDELVRMALRTLVERAAGLRLVGECADGVATLAQLRRARPDVLLLDLHMPRLDGLGVLRAVATDPALGGTAVVVVTTFDDDVLGALRAGAAGFVSKSAAPTDLVRAVRAAAAGQALLSPAVTRRVLEALVPASAGPLPSRRAWGRLTAREREMVGWVATGRSNVEIAAELVLSPDTVRTHVGRAMVKLDARDRAQLVVFAVREGLGARVGPARRY